MPVLDFEVQIAAAPRDKKWEIGDVGHHAVIITRCLPGINLVWATVSLAEKPRCFPPRSGAISYLCTAQRRYLLSLGRAAAIFPAAQRRRRRRSRGLRNWIVSPSAPRVAAGDAPNRKPTATEHAPLSKGFDAVCGTSRMKATVGPEQGTQQHLVKPYQEDKQVPHGKVRRGGGPGRVRPSRRRRFPR